MYLRLLDAGARGQYLPDLLVQHVVHPDRLSKRYFRSWCFWNGASKGVALTAQLPLHLAARAQFVEQIHEEPIAFGIDAESCEKAGEQRSAQL